MKHRLETKPFKLRFEEIAEITLSPEDYPNILEIREKQTKYREEMNQAKNNG